MIQPTFSASHYNRPQLTAVRFGCAAHSGGADAVKEGVQKIGQDRKATVEAMDKLIAESGGLKKLGLKLIRWYKNNRFIHEKLYNMELNLGFTKLKLKLVCNYAAEGMPSCSQYGFAAVERYGFFKGSLMALGRILNCNPISGKLGLTKRFFRVI